jgi:hypothetical protein
MDMTNDDLTPEEREALSSLPRERMPSAGLEDRVVAAMREQGHIAARKPARVIRLTTSRVAGLLAACLVLMIGAYSIGLHGRVSHEVLKNIEPQPREYSNEARQDELTKQKPAATGLVQSQSESGASAPEQAFIKKDAPPFEPRLAVPKLAPSEAKKENRPARDEVTESMQKTFTEGIAQGNIPGATDMAAPSSPPMASQMRAKSTAPETASSRMSTLTPTSRTFAITGGTLIVDAPDSLRIVTDEYGRTLLIYTSDGVIRIRLAD